LQISDKCCKIEVTGRTLNYGNVGYVGNTEISAFEITPKIKLG
jgi:hypothetical protein